MLTVRELLRVPRSAISLKVHILVGIETTLISSGSKPSGLAAPGNSKLRHFTGFTANWQN